jgi:hypothetical protein
MGDSRNIVVHGSAEADVVLYTHWGGSELPQTLAKALGRGRGRWDDAPYLTRMIFCEMIAAEAGDDVVAALMSETGLGIEAVPTEWDGIEGTDLYVDVAAQTVYDGDETTYSFDRYVETYRE